MCLATSWQTNWNLFYLSYSTKHTVTFSYLHQFKHQMVPGAGILHIECILHIEWGSVIAQLEFYHCWEPAWGTPPMTKVMRKEAWHTQRRDRASGVPLEILEHLPPKPESAYFLLCAFTYTSDFTGGCLPLPLSEKRVSLRLQLIILGCDSV